MALLKALVIGMGILIVLAMGMLAYGLISKTGSSPDMGAATTPAPAVTGSFGDITIPDAGHCRIDGTALDGANLIVTLGGPATCRRVVVIDTTTGAIAGTVRLTP